MFKIDISKECHAFLFKKISEPIDSLCKNCVLYSCEIICEKYANGKCYKINDLFNRKKVYPEDCLMCYHYKRECRRDCMTCNHNNSGACKCKNPDYIKD